MSFKSTSPNANARIVTDKACVPAFPPIPLIIVITEDNMTTFSTVLENSPITNDAKNAVPKFITSHGSLCFTENQKSE